MLIVIFALVVAFAVSVISSILGVVFGMPYLNYLSPDENALTVLGVINLLFLVGTPILLIILSLSRLLLGSRINPAWTSGMVILMIINAVSLGVLTSFLGRQFSADTESSRIQELTLENNDTLQLQLGNDALARPWINIDNKVRLNDQELALQNVDLRITRAEDEQFHLTQKVYTRGRDQAEATMLAGNLHYQVRQDGNILTIPPDIILKRGEKWRAQEVTLVLEVPWGRSLLMHQNIHRILSSIDLEDRKVTPWAYPGKVWRMETEGLRCLNCMAEKEEMLSSR